MGVFSKKATFKGMPQQAMGIKELKDVVKAGLEIGQALSDGVQIEDITALLSLPEAITGIADVPEELKDLDDAEINELRAFVRDNFDITDDRVEEFIEESILVCMQIFKLYLLFRNLDREEASEE